MDLATAREEFVAHLASLNKSMLTCQTYGYSLDRFFGFLQQKREIPSSADLSVLTLGQIDGYSDWLYNQDLASRTRYKYLVVIRNWVRYLKSRGWIDMDMSLITLPKYGRLVGHVDSRILLLLQVNPPAADPWRDLIRLRDRAIIQTFFSTQLRVSEVGALDRSSIDWDKGYAVINNGVRLRTVFFSDSCLDALTLYLDARHDEFPPLFVHHDRAHRKSNVERGHVEGEDMRLTRQGIERVVHRYAQLAGIEATPHSFRIYGATELLRNGADVHVVQELLGHASVATTQMYVPVEPALSRQEWEGFHPTTRTESV